MAWTTAGSRSAMSGYELHDQLSGQFLRPAGGYFANFSSSVGSNSEEIYSRQALYSSYTWGERLAGYRAPCARSLVLLDALYENAMQLLPGHLAVLVAVRHAQHAPRDDAASHVLAQCRSQRVHNLVLAEVAVLVHVR